MQETEALGVRGGDLPPVGQPHRRDLVRVHPIAVEHTVSNSQTLRRMLCETAPKLLPAFQHIGDGLAENSGAYTLSDTNFRNFITLLSSFGRL